MMEPVRILLRFKTSGSLYVEVNMLGHADETLNYGGLNVGKTVNPSSAYINVMEE